MRLTEAKLSGLRSPASGHVYLQTPGENVAGLFTPSWTFFPAELGDAGNGVVAILAFTQVVPKLDAGLEWVAIRHQSGGYSCSAPVFVGVRLALRPHIADWLNG